MKLFREKSLTKVSSPEQLNEYMKVTSTPIWINLIAVIFLLLGLCMWVLMGQLKTTMTVDAQGDTYRSYSEIDASMKGDLQIGAEIICEGYQGNVEELVEVGQRIQVIGRFQEVLPEAMVCDITTTSASWFSLLIPFGKPL